MMAITRSTCKPRNFGHMSQDKPPIVKTVLGAVCLVWSLCFTPNFFATRTPLTNFNSDQLRVKFYATNYHRRREVTSVSRNLLCLCQECNNESQRRSLMYHVIVFLFYMTFEESKPWSAVFFVFFLELRSATRRKLIRCSFARVSTECHKLRTKERHSKMAAGLTNLSYKLISKSELAKRNLCFFPLSPSWSKDGDLPIDIFKSKQQKLAAKSHMKTLSFVFFCGRKD